ncbi:MAG: glycosyltransferase [Blastocatellia bacterium]
MKLAVVSHKVCWRSADSPTGYITDGGFPLQMGAISELFDETRVVVPCGSGDGGNGLSPLDGHNLTIRELSLPKGKGLARKLGFPFWILTNGWKIFGEVRRADAVHTPIPGDVGTIGMLIALLMRKPLFVRHCGNWMVQRTLAEKFWKWIMERFAGGQNVMLATGGTDQPPSSRNQNIKWIFSTSLSREQIGKAQVRSLSTSGKLKLITACRLEKRKGVDVVISSMPRILSRFPGTTLNIVGDGSMFEALKRLAYNLGVSESIIFHGKVRQSEVIELMNQSDVFCFPTSASEGFPKVVFEALACGLPIITTRVSVLPKLVENGAGILIDQPTENVMADAVTELCENPDKYRQMSERAIDAAQAYSIEHWRDFIAQTLCRAWQVPSLSNRTPVLRSSVSI